MRVFLALLAFAILIGGILMSAFVSAAWFSIPEAGAPVSIIVGEEETADAVADALQSSGLLKTRLGYDMFASLYPPARRPKAGSYSFRKGTPYKTIADVIALGPKREEVSIQIIEGKTINDEAEQLKAYGVDPSLVYALTGRTRPSLPFDAALAEDFDFLKDIPSGQSLEGYLFPDTYRVWKDQLPEGLIRKQLRAFVEKALIPLDADRKASGMSWHEIITLASIVEAEVQHSEDRQIVAGIFLKRMKNGMRLQSDATLNYILQSGRSRATADDLATDSPYNTYRRDGLPPGPINQPSLSSIRAVLSPLMTDYYFFLTGKDGAVHYARTFEEHIANKTNL
ncbi:endolytic transglycosylase MltG [Patescibacteria group bacterium]|uniref:Endolytic murein transglycosylase n=1 Tax=candidate division WWE3 bacterium TaxID=2053526 RepID=A0A928TTD7_UNCKA|nr:endolytic transglycosylase MltG [candidate division WWE3 bacterium]MCL4732415.1 endolytic transglycosylase MltG [Patescibacteria group bacterium]MDL1952840.1 endolytic transglycosylase MltG [Candidatus Uhrbacteria bacterium UHB]RIL01076.1 MAG: endolytic transglycosylase MltG [Candidatus Uhrbacteria bacterium]